MNVSIKLDALRDVHWYEYAIRFMLGGTMTVIAGEIAMRFGATAGGLFLAFPAILPASVTLVEKHIRQHKEEKGLSGTCRGRAAAALDARGAALSGLGMIAFAFTVYQLIAFSPPAALIAATAAWIVISISAWLWQRRV